MFVLFFILNVYIYIYIYIYIFKKITQKKNVNAVKQYKTNKQIS